VLADGLTPELRTKLRHKHLTPEQASLSRARKKDWLVRFRKRHADNKVSLPTPIIEGDTWSWWPPSGPNQGKVHDGVDIIAPWNAPMLAPVRSKVVRADADGWWGKGAAPSAGHPIGDGDGIIILEVLEAVGPFRKGMHVCYGHGEHAAVDEGQVVRAGEFIGRVGWAKTSHIHWMINETAPVDGFYTGRGDRDPTPYLAFLKAHV
jgi:murein DD-endopeptidase MepM/ murein hydrolase activator NlpD